VEYFNRSFLKQVFIIYTVTQPDWWDTISDEEREEIEQGLTEADRGEVIPHEEVMAKYKKWL
jgi:predicted transcriptional regulator